MKQLILLLFFLKIVWTDNNFFDKSHMLLSEALTPYIKNHGSGLNHDEIRECHAQEHGTVPHELFTIQNVSVPHVRLQRFIRRIDSFPYRTIRGHYVVISNALKTLTILEPDDKGGCSHNSRQTVLETTKQHKCIIALNAGYFDTKKGTCYGNVISNGQLVQDSNGIQNAHFGITKNGQIFTGYLSRDDVLSENFEQLVGGVVWIIRNGTKFVNASKKMECEDTEETGSMEDFVSILSARSVIGHDASGNVVLLQVDGKSGVDGINLYEMEDLLHSLGVVNGINLDGGGSSTLLVNGTTVNYPYDACEDKSFACDRKVSTVICVHSPYCEPADCNGHGVCIEGLCSCDRNWMLPDCNQLSCGLQNCTQNGVCTPEGCICQSGYQGIDCNESCPEGWFGSHCKQRCECSHSIGCNPTNGSCFCNNGFFGNKCDQVCPVGFYGQSCRFQCQCNHSCYCDPVSGSCDLQPDSTLYSAAQCIAEHMSANKNLAVDYSEEKRKWFVTMIILGMITAFCLASFLLLLCCSCSCRCHNEQVLCARKMYRKYPLPGGYLSDSMSDSESLPMKTRS